MLFNQYLLPKRIRFEEHFSITDVDGNNVKATQGRKNYRMRRLHFDNLMEDRMLLNNWYEPYVNMTIILDAQTELCWVIV